MDKKSKHLLVESALDLFYHQGFHQTTVRQIARKAQMNQALISYHFGSKAGLLEEIMSSFYEGYFAALEQVQDHEDDGQVSFDVSTPSERLISTLKCSYDYLFSSYLMTRFIYRELSLDSSLTREVTPLYLAREKYIYESLYQDVYSTDPNSEADEDDDMTVFQMLNMLYMPFLQPQIVREVYHVEPHSENFKERYWKQLQKWLEYELNSKI